MFASWPTVNLDRFCFREDMSLAVESVSQLVPGTPCLKWRSEGNDSPCEAVVPNVPCRQYNGFNASPRDSRLNVFQGNLRD